MKLKKSNYKEESWTQLLHLDTEIDVILQETSLLSN